jgi:predicted DNA-binding transcriptional regulator AlpA
METKAAPEERRRGRPRKPVVLPSGTFQERTREVGEPERKVVWDDEDRLLTIDEVADLLRVRPKTIHYNKSQHPERVPPWIRLPGFRSPLWRLKDVRAWIEQGVAGGEKERARIEEMRQEGLYPFPKKKRGRPSKREALAK